MKSMASRPEQGANRSDSRSYREDLQRSAGCEDAISCAAIYGTAHLLASMPEAFAPKDNGALSLGRKEQQGGEATFKTPHDLRELIGPAAKEQVGLLFQKRARQDFMPTRHAVAVFAREVIQPLRQQGSLFR